MTTPSDPRKRLAALMNACAESVESMTDEAVLAEADATGVDSNAEAIRVRGLLLGAVVKAKKARLAEATREHQKNVALFASRASRRIPSVASERRALLLQAFERRPQMKDALVTLQHRDFSALSDADIESLLNQLDALGLLGDEDPKQKT